MIISGSILKIKNEKNKINKFINSGIDYLHLDVMDGIFVDNISKFDDINLYSIPLDIHLMVNNPIEYIDYYSKFNPKFITIHYEISNLDECIDYIKSKNISVGVAIKPNTSIEKIIPILNKIDLVLIMSVEPGYGGQTFIENSYKKIEELMNYKKQYNFLVEVDGGININNISQIKSDIVVIGSGITDLDNYQDSVNRIRGLL